MEIKQIKELMSAMERNDTTHLRLKQGDFEIELRRNATHPASTLQEFEEHEEEKASIKPYKRALPKGKDMAAALHAEEPAKREEAAGIYITSPMVGTFYSSPSPDEPHPFVKVGDLVEKGAVVCIIEAMKVMNEIKSQVSGTIAEICVENGHPVEFGTKLFRIQ